MTDDERIYYEFLVQEFPGCSDEELLEEYEAACNLNIPLPNPEPSPEQFERIWERIQAEQEKAEKVEPKLEWNHRGMLRRFFDWFRHKR